MSRARGQWTIFSLENCARRTLEHWNLVSAARKANDTEGITRHTEQAQLWKKRYRHAVEVKAMTTRRSWTHPEQD